VSDDLKLLQQFRADKLQLLLRHQAAAKLIGQYDINNTYQYIINREETQLTWLDVAIAELGGTSAEDAAELDRGANAKRADAARRAIDEDVQEAQAFVDRWRSRIDTMTSARHAKMLRLIIGETLEGKRFFEQAQAGRTDLLGRRGAQLLPSHGEVLPARWVE